MKIIWSNIKPKPEKKDIDGIKKKFKLIFPKDFLETIQNANGALCETNIFSKGEREYALGNILDFRLNIDDNSFEKINIKSHKWLPENFYIIGLDPGDDYFCLNFNDNPASVYYISREEVMDFKDEEIEKIKGTFLAQSWTEFLEGLHD